MHMKSTVALLVLLGSLTTLSSMAQDNTSSLPTAPPKPGFTLSSHNQTYLTVRGDGMGSNLYSGNQFRAGYMINHNWEVGAQLNYNLSWITTPEGTGGGIWGVTGGAYATRYFGKGPFRAYVRGAALFGIYDSHDFELALGVGAEYQFNEHWSVQVENTSKFEWDSNSLTPFTGRLFSPSLGLRYKF